MIKTLTGEKRFLHADEIECRFGQKSKDGQKYSVLLYKTSRTDMEILDEIFGSENWQSEHYEVKGKDFCKIGVKFEDAWIWKSDCGDESNIEASKGESSDAFKRAGVQWGIGRELYSAPQIWLENDINAYSLQVSEITYSDMGKIKSLKLTGSRNGKREVVFSYGEDKSEIIKEILASGGNSERICEYYKVKRLEDLTVQVLNKVLEKGKKQV